MKLTSSKEKIQHFSLLALHEYNRADLLDLSYKSSSAVHGPVYSI